MKKEICVGDTASFSKSISEEDVNTYAKLTGDFNPIHVDECKAQKSIFKRRIVHGMLTSSLISSVIGNILPGEGTVYLEQMLKFKKPVYFDDTCTAYVEVIEIMNLEKGIYKLNTFITNQLDEIVLDGYAVVKYI